MSVVISYISKRITVIASDTRISFGHNAEHGFCDDVVKLINLKNMGWTSGVGFGDFLDTFKNQLDQTDVKTYNDITSVYEKVLAGSIEQAPQYEEDIRKSALVVSWTGFNPEQGLIQRLCLLSRDGLSFLENNHFFILYPAEYVANPEMAEELESRYNQLQYESLAFEEIIGTIAGLFHEISSHSVTVSRNLDIGVHVITETGVEKSLVKINMTDYDNINISSEQVSFLEFPNHAE